MIASNILCSEFVKGPSNKKYKTIIIDKFKSSIRQITQVK